MAGPDILLLGPFRLFRNERLLTLAGRPVSLPLGAVDLLLTLLSRPGEDLSEAALDSQLQRLHPRGRLAVPALCEALNAALSEGSPRHYVAQLDDDAFTFFGEVRTADAGSTDIGAGPGALPTLRDDLVPRDALLTHIFERIRGARLVTLKGPGGVGKTTAAVVAAQRWQTSDGVRACFVDLAAVHEPGGVGRAVLLALGWEPQIVAAEGTPSLEECLHVALLGRRVLVLLDNCEHLVAEAAAVVEVLLRAKDAQVLATSREPLNTFGEVVVPVGPLTVPPDTAPAAPEAARASEAVQMMVSLASRRGVPAAQLARELPDLCEICRRLDGIPLALDLAAAHMPAMSASELLERLRSWPVLSLGDAAPGIGRHRTLEAAFDWSYQLLSPQEQTALQRLSVFRGEFPLDSAMRVISLGDGAIDATPSLFGLKEKSLLAVTLTQGAVKYRLLETTREYAEVRLREDDRAREVMRQHALDCLLRLEQAESEWTSSHGRGWLARHGRLVDDVWQATQWALGTDGDVGIGAALVLKGLPMVSRLGRYDDSHSRITRALAALNGAGRGRHPREELQLLVSLRTMALNTKRDFAALPGSEARILELVDELGDDRNAFAACISLWVTSVALADYPRSLDAARKLIAFADRSGQKVDVVDAAKHAAYSCHYVGDQQAARRHAEHVLELMPEAVSPRYYNVAQCDARVSARIVLARVQWLAGQFPEAARTANVAFSLAKDDRPLAVCLVLAFVLCPLALWNGDLESAKNHAETLKDWTVRHQFKLYEEWADWYALLAAHQGRLEETDVPAAWGRPNDMLADMLAAQGCAWLLPRSAGRVAAGLVGWHAPELMRLQAAEAIGRGRRAEGKAKLAEALALAVRTDGMAWAHRCRQDLAALETADGLSSA